MRRNPSAQDQGGKKNLKKSTSRTCTTKPDIQVRDIGYVIDWFALLVASCANCACHALLRQPCGLPNKKSKGNINVFSLSIDPHLLHYRHNAKETPQYRCNSQSYQDQHTASCSQFSATGYRALDAIASPFPVGGGRNRIVLEVVFCTGQIKPHVKEVFLFQIKYISINHLLNTILDCPTTI